jgi:ATP-dependent helicase HrpA
LAAVSAGLEQTAVVEFPPGGVQREVSESVGDHTVTGYPALAHRGGQVDLVVLATRSEQADAMAGGVRALLLESIPSPVRRVVAGLGTRQKLALAGTPYPGVPAMLNDTVAAAVDELVAADGVPYDRAGYDAVLLTVRQQLVGTVERAVGRLAELLTVVAEVRATLATLPGPATAALVADVGAQVDDLIADGFVTAVGTVRLPDLVRYLKAAARRLERAPHELARDAVKQSEVVAVTAAVAAGIAAHPGPAAAALRWQVQELRVSLFAQGIGTAHPVSSTRILKAVAALD